MTSIEQIRDHPNGPRHSLPDMVIQQQQQQKRVVPRALKYACAVTQSTNRQCHQVLQPLWWRQQKHSLSNEWPTDGHAHRRGAGSNQARRVDFYSPAATFCNIPQPSPRMDKVNRKTRLPKAFHLSELQRLQKVTNRRLIPSMSNLFF